jgi:hypothetical protein
MNFALQNIDLRRFISRSLSGILAVPFVLTNNPPPAATMFCSQSLIGLLEGLIILLTHYDIALNFPAIPIIPFLSLSKLGPISLGLDSAFLGK